MIHYYSRTKIHPSITELLTSDGSTVCSDPEMATLFNGYFSTAFTCEDTTTIPTVDSASSLIADSIEITPAVAYHTLAILLVQY